MTSRNYIYTSIIALTPFAVLLLAFFSYWEDLSLLEKRIHRIHTQVIHDHEKYTHNNAILSQYKERDALYTETVLQKMTFLHEEALALEELLENPVPFNSSLRQRLEFLRGPQNRLSFVEDTIESYDTYRETREVMRHTVEVDIDDIATILSKVEGVAIDSHAPDAEAPHYLIADFELQRKKHSNNNEIFSLSMNLIKREYY
jgi:hypothetical protein